MRAAATVLLMLLAASMLSGGQASCSKPDPRGLRRFLEEQYVAGVGLLRASPVAMGENQTIYIANDNILAAYALDSLGSPLARSVFQSLSHYSRVWNDKVDVLVAHPITGLFYAKAETTVGRKGSIIVKYEWMNKSAPMEDWRRYADLLVYHALNALLHGDAGTALQDYEALISMWDGSGFRDKAYNSSLRRRGVEEYEAYKLALAYYLHEALRAAGISRDEELAEKWGWMLACLQDKASGGIHTYYKVVGNTPIPLSSPNTETTSITALALYSPYPYIIGSKPGEAADPPPTPLLAAASLILILLLYVLLTHRGDHHPEVHAGT